MLLDAYLRAETVQSMSRLTDTARAAVQRSQRTATLPDWWIAAGGVLLALIVLALILQVLNPGSDETTAQSDGTGVTEPLAPSAGDQNTPALPTAGPEDSAPTAKPEPTPPPPAPTGPSFTVTEGNGRGTISVPASANDFARSALRALYSGSTKVPVAPGSKPVAALGTFASPQLSDVSAAIDHGDSLQLFFTMDPDGPGSLAQRTVSIHVAEQGGAYAVLVR